MSELPLAINNYKVDSSQNRNLLFFQEILRQKCQQQIRDRRCRLFGKGRSNLLSCNDVQKTLMEIVQEQFNNLATAKKSDITSSTKNTTNCSPLDFEEALIEEHRIIAEEEQWIMQEYERLRNSEDEMFDTLEDEVVCPMCQKSFIEEIPDFIVCSKCGLKIRSEISLSKFKQNLVMQIDVHSKNCAQVPHFSLVHDSNTTSLGISCIVCSSYFIVKSMEP